MSRLRLTANYATPGQKEGKIVVSGNQMVSIGSSGAADFRIPDDQLHPIHFHIQLSSTQATLIGEKSKPTVAINGQKTAKAELHDGDTFLAGSTNFQIVMEGKSSPTNAEKSHRSTMSAAPLTPTRDVATSTPKKAANSQQAMEEIDNGEEFFGLTNKKATPELAVESLERLMKLGSYFFIVDFSRIDKAIPDSVSPSENQLFDWFPDEMALQSPQVISASELPQWKNLFLDGWGCDGLIGIQCDQPLESIVNWLRNSIRPSTSRNAEAITGYCWPSVLCQMLANNTDGFADALFNEVNHVFFEATGGNDWQLVAANSQRKNLGKLGFQATS